MAKGRKTEPESAKVLSSEVSLNRISRALALLAIRDAAESDKIATLHLIGFSNQEAADLLMTTAGNVAQTLYLRRKAPRRAKKAKA